MPSLFAPQHTLIQPERVHINDRVWTHEESHRRRPEQIRTGRLLNHITYAQKRLHETHYCQKLKSQSFLALLLLTIFFTPLA